MHYDRVSFATATTGTGTITAGAATTGFRTMAGASIPDGTLVEYAIEDGTAWETGTGTVGATSTTLARTFSQSSTAALLNLSGTAKCFLTPIASRLNALNSGTTSTVAGRTRRSTNQLIPAGASFTLVSFDTAAMAVGGTFYSGATPTEAIIPEDGVYQIDFEGTGEGTAVIVTWEMQVSILGGAVLGGDQFMAPASATAPLSNGTTQQFTSGQRITVGIKHNNATALNLLTEGTHSPAIRIVKVGGAESNPWTYIKLAADQDVSLATFVDLTGMAFTPDISSDYEVEWCLLAQTATTTVGPRPAATWAANLSYGGASLYTPSSRTAEAILHENIGATSGSAQAAVGGLPQANATFRHRGQAHFRSGSGAQGAFKLQMASETAGTIVKTKAGSYLKYRKF